MGLMNKLRGRSQVEMQLSVGDHVAGKRYNLPVEVADRYVVRGYATGSCSRVFTSDELQGLRGNPQVVTLQMSAAYDLGLEKFTKGTIDLVNNTIKVRAGRASAYTFSQTHEFASSLPAGLVTDVTLGTKVVASGTLDAADAVFAAVPAGAAIDRLWVFKFVTADSDSPLIAEITGFTVTPNGGDITMQFQSTTPFILKI